MNSRNNSSNQELSLIRGDYDPYTYKSHYSLGFGTNGTVYLSTYQTQLVALKVARPEYVLNLAEEYRHHKKLTQWSTANIVPVIGENLRHNPPYILMQYMVNGSLRSLIERDFSLNLLQRIHIMQGIARGLAGIHAHGLSYRDVKSGNVLIDDKLNAYICDFGSTRVYNTAAGYQSQDKLITGGTRGYIAPEIYNNNPKVYTQNSDVWSAGTVFWETMTFRDPTAYYDHTEYNFDAEDCLLIEYNSYHKLPKTCPPQIENLIKACWNMKPSERPSFRQLDHAFEEFKLALTTAQISRIIGMEVAVVSIKSLTADNKRSLNQEQPVTDNNTPTKKEDSEKALVQASRASLPPVSLAASHRFFGVSVKPPAVVTQIYEAVTKAFKWGGSS